jgi:hypothetical protein
MDPRRLIEVSQGQTRFSPLIPHTPNHYPLRNCSVCVLDEEGRMQRREEALAYEAYLLSEFLSEAL